MKRLFICGLVLAASSGCRMCASPYDYCGPVYDSAPPNPPQYSAPPMGDAPPPLEDGPAIDIPIPEESIPDSPQPSSRKSARAKPKATSRSVMRR